MKTTSVHEKALGQFKILEVANQMLFSRGSELEASLAQAKNNLVQQTAELEVAKAELVQFKEDRAS